MEIIIDESMGRSYWCFICETEKPDDYDKPQIQPNGIHEEKGDKNAA